jgi:hypothetical protein
MLELDDFGIDTIHGNGGFTVAYDNGNIKAEVNIYNENHDTKIYEDDVLEARIIFEDGSTVEITN